MKLLLLGNRRLKSDAIKDYISLRLRNALDRFTSMIISARVRLEDLNGPRGGIDKRCKVLLSLASGQHLAIEATSNDAYVAVDWAAQRAKLRLSRYMDKLKSH